MTARAVVAGLPIVAIARALGPLNERVVFIGAAIAPLLHTARVFLQPRATDDVDAVAATASYSEFHEIETGLTDRGFRQDLKEQAHMNRWRSPDGIKFDLVPCGAHPGGTGSPVDQAAVRTAVSVEIEAGLVIRHSAAPAFLAQKLLAYRDRGRDDPLMSDDLTDILALLASRPEIVQELSTAPGDIRDVVVKETGEITRDPYLEDLVAAHLGGAQDPGATIAAVVGRLKRIGGT